MESDQRKMDIEIFGLISVLYIYIEIHAITIIVLTSHFFEYRCLFDKMVVYGVNFVLLVV